MTKVCFSFIFHILFQKAHSKNKLITRRANNSTECNIVEVCYKFGFPINQAEDDGGEDCEVPLELARLLKNEEKVIPLYKEPIEVRRNVKIGASLAEHVHSELVKLLREYIDIFS